MSDLQLPLKASMTSMNERTRALLRYHFEHDSRRVFMMAGSTDVADVLIVDYDHPGTRVNLEAGQWQSERAMMVLAYGEPAIDGVVVVHKPLDRARLEAAAYQVLHEASQSLDETSPDRADPSAIDSAVLERAAPGALTGNLTEERTEASTEPDRPLPSAPGEIRRNKAAVRDAARHQAKMVRLCGEPRSLEDLADPDDELHRYEPRRFFNHQLDEAVARCHHDIEAICLSVSDIDVYAMPALNRIYMTESLKRAVNVDRVFRALEPHDVETTTYRPADLPDLLTRIDGRARYAYSFDAFTWLGGLFAASGRLPHDADIHQQHYLRRWPNFTRLELTPDCMYIAAAWSARASSIAEIVSAVGCEPHHVTSFYNGAIALGLLYETDTSTAGTYKERL